jgi:hypothetical protein
VVETTEKCNWEKKKGGVLSLDIKKAFDSLSHSYLESVFKFYNFGPNICKWLKLMATNRKACIVLDDGSVTSFFDLERGNAQGDTLSPFLFMLGYQILLMKLDLNLQIEGLLERVEIPENHPVPPPLPERREVSFIPPKVYAMADDATLLVKLEVGTLTMVKAILESFELLSGLGCNVDKTVLMQIGTDTEIPIGITTLGFDIKNQVTILGMIIKNTGNNFSENISNMLEKIRSQVRFWTRFNLSLPGRINIAKTFMYSQLTYLGCLIPIPITAVNGLSREIENFVNGTLNISRKRIFQKRCEGGLELIDVKMFLASQASVWVKRATNLDDHWKLRLYKNSYGNIYNLRAKNFDAKTEPILHHIVSCFEKFLIAFTMVNENFRASFIFDNPSVPFEQGRNNFFGSRFIDWGANRATTAKLQNLRVSDILPSVGNPLSWEEFRDRTGIGIPLQKFTVLKRACTSLEHRAIKEIPYQKKSESIEQWCNSKRQLSRKIRLILEDDLIEEIPHNIRKFSENTETIINLNQSRTLNGLWGNKFFDNGMKTFLFKLLNNTLGYNYIVANFVRNINKDCSFCILNGVGIKTRETPLHLFFDCPSVEPTLKTFYNWLWNTLDVL